MYRKRSTLLTLNSFKSSLNFSKSFSKVCSRPNFLYSIKPLGFVRTLNIACERSDFQSPSDFNGDNRVEYQQNPSRFYGENKNDVQFQHRFDGHASQHHPGGFKAESSRGYWNSSSEAYGEKMGSQNLYGTSREWQRFGQSNPYGFWAQNNVMPSGALNGSYGESLRQFGNGVDNYGNPDNYYMGTAENYSGRSGAPQQTLNNHCIGNKVLTPQNQDNYYAGSSMQSQYFSNNQNVSNGGIYREKFSGDQGENIGSSIGHGMQNGGYQQNAGGSYIANSGSYQQNSNQYWNGVVDPQVSCNPNPDRQLVEAAEGSQSRGTLEELDGFCREGKLKEAVEVLGLLERQGILVDLARFLTLIKACGEAKALQEAKHVHGHLVKSISAPKVSTYNKILEMYGKCGSMEDVYAVFDNMPQRNLTSWDTVITWLAKNDLGEEAIELFSQFKKVGLKPDGQMFIGVFAACGVLGDIIEGMLHFKSMSKDFGIVPSMEHYVSVVDMLGSAGYLDEALEFIEKMPVEPSVDVWETLMNLCRVHGNMELGDRCAQLIELMEPSRLNEQSKAGLIPVKASDLAKEKEKKKLAAENLLAVRSRVHEYRAGDTSHPEKDRIYALLRGMKEQLKEAGYVAETRFVLHDIDQEGKEDALLAHSERLAVAYGLISSPVRAPIRIIKNLRVCGDCHTALKIISKLVGRELIIRDAKRFHHFKDGLCSCRDYW